MSKKSLSYQGLLQQRVVLVGLVLALVVVMLGIGVQLFSSQQRSQVDPELQKMARPLNPTLDIEILEKVDRYQQLNSTQLHQQIRELQQRKAVVVPIIAATDSAASDSLVESESSIATSAATQVVLPTKPVSPTQPTEGDL